MLPLLYQSGFNTEGFPTLEDYLYQTVSTLPCQSLLRLALDSVFEEFPEISAIQTKVYRMLKCHLSVINHPFITQFDDISLANHDFDRVVYMRYVSPYLLKNSFLRLEIFRKDSISSWELKG